MENSAVNQRIALALQQVPREEVGSAAKAVAKRYMVEPVEIPESGLYLLQLEDGVMNERFYLGEISGSRAVVRLGEPGSGWSWEGGAIIMADDAELAEWVAICDAILSNHLDGWEVVQELVGRGMKIIEAEQEKRREMLARTRVDFSLLDRKSGSEF